jgi:hypothetical protein
MLSPVNLHASLASSLDGLLAALALILAGSICGAGDVGIIPPSRPVRLGPKIAASAGILHVVEPLFGAGTVGGFRVEAVQTHGLPAPAEQNLVPGVDLRQNNTML